MTPLPAIERSLDALETTLWLLDRLARLSGIVVAEVAGPLTESALRAALDAVQQRHPLLRVRIVLEEGNRLIYRGGVPPIPLRVVESPPETWLVEGEREQQSPFPTESGPLFRCTWLRHG